MVDQVQHQQFFALFEFGEAEPLGLGHDALEFEACEQFGVPPFEQPTPQFGVGPGESRSPDRSARDARKRNQAMPNWAFDVNK